MGGGVIQLSLALQVKEPQALIPAAPVQRSSTPVIRQRAEAHPLVLKLIRDGTLDFLNATRLPPGFKEVKTARKKPAGRPAWLPRRK